MSLTRYEPARPRLQRSELAVPGSQPALFKKALDSEADYVFLDLEDAVAPADKEPARKNVVTALLEHEWRDHGKTACVRINGIDTHYMTWWTWWRRPATASIVSSCRRSGFRPTCIWWTRC